MTVESRDATRRRFRRSGIPEDAIERLLSLHAKELGEDEEEVVFVETTDNGVTMSPPIVRKTTSSTPEGPEALADVVVEMIVKPMSAKIAALDARIKTLEARPALSFAGVWQKDASYRPGACVIRSGSLWVCVDDETSGAEPGTDAGARAWRLAVKNGEVRR